MFSSVGVSFRVRFRKDKKRPAVLIWCNYVCVSRNKFKIIPGRVSLVLTPEASGSWEERIVYSFCSKADRTDGANPEAGLVLDAKGNLYGTPTEEAVPATEWYSRPSQSTASRSSRAVCQAPSSVAREPATFTFWVSHLASRALGTLFRGKGSR